MKKKKRQPNAARNAFIARSLSLMQPALARLDHVLVAVDHHGDLLANGVEAAEHLLVALDEAEDGVGDARVLAKLLDQLLDLAQVVARHAREEVVDDLELQAAVDKVHPGGAVDVHGGSQLALGERLLLAEVGGGHAPVGEGDLDVQRHDGDVADDDEDDADGPGGQGAPDEAVAEEEPVAAHEGDLGRADPPAAGGVEAGRLRREDVQPG